TRIPRAGAAGAPGSIVASEISASHTSSWARQNGRRNGSKPTYHGEANPASSSFSRGRSAPMSLAPDGPRLSGRWSRWRYGWHALDEFEVAPEEAAAGRSGIEPAPVRSDGERKRTVGRETFRVRMPVHASVDRSIDTGPRAEIEHAGARR